MKPLILFFALVCCSFTGYKCAAQNSTNSRDVICNNPLCVKYYNIWKTIFLKRNSMSGEYFSKHVYVTGDWIESYKYRASFNINYNITIDWETSKTSDLFVIKTTNPPNPKLSINNDNYLGLEEVEKALDNKSYGSHISKRTPDEHLKCTSKESAIQAAKDNVAGRKMAYGGCDVHYNYYDDTLGHPVLYCRFNLAGGNTFGENVDLVTGRINIPAQSCSICDSPLCVKYCNIWKELFMKRNNMSAEYFKSHVEVQGVAVYFGKTSASFEVHYVTTIDWASCDGDDKFMIKIDSRSYPDLKISRDTYLSRDEIEQVVDVKAFRSGISIRKPVEHLKFATREAAFRAAKENVPVNISDEGNRISYPDWEQPCSGHPTMYCPYEQGSNSCFIEKLDLVTGEIKTVKTDCIVE
jgi:hypothetical protein